MNTDVMKEWLKSVSTRLRSVAHSHQPILLVDAYKPHFSDDVLALSARLRIWIVSIPAQVTSLLQPLDTHFFGRLKQKLRKRGVPNGVQENAGGEIANANLLRNLSHADHEVVISKNWSDVFDQNGFGVVSRPVREKILLAAGLRGLPRVEADMPSLASFQACFPQRCIINFDALFRRMLLHGAEPGSAAIERPPLRRGSRLMTAGPEPSPAQGVIVQPLPDSPASVANQSTWTSAPAPPPLPPPPQPPPRVRASRLLPRSASLL